MIHRPAIQVQQLYAKGHLLYVRGKAMGRNGGTNERNAAELKQQMSSRLWVGIRVGRSITGSVVLQPSHGSMLLAPKVTGKCMLLLAQFIAQYQGNPNTRLPGKKPNYGYIR